MTDLRVTRREALKSAAGTGLLFLLPMFPGEAQPPAPWIAAGKTETFVLNQPQRIVLAGGATLWITRTAPKQWTAVSAKCTHKGCEVGWDKTQSDFVCPCHGAVFAISGKNLHGTRRKPDELLPALPVVPAREKKGQVEVQLSPAADAPKTAFAFPSVF